MYLSLYGPTHLQTLKELMEIAEKHNCYINIFVNEHHSFAQDNSSACLEMLVDREYISDEVANNLLECYSIDNPMVQHDSICFELVEQKENRNIFHTMTYHTWSVWFNIEKYSWNPEADELPETEEWVEENCSDYGDGFYSAESAYTEVQGFPNVETKVNVYREGIAIKNFGDLVCDYLGEPRIVRNY